MILLKCLIDSVKISIKGVRFSSESDHYPYTMLKEQNAPPQYELIKTYTRSGVSEFRGPFLNNMQYADVDLEGNTWIVRIGPILEQIDETSGIEGNFKGPVQEVHRLPVDDGRFDLHNGQ